MQLITGAFQSSALHDKAHTYTQVPFHFIKPGKPLGFGYEIFPQDEEEN
jgi:hypothetical protein